jgi:hypothetical protein
MEKEENEEEEEEDFNDDWQYKVFMRLKQLETDKNTKC